MRSNFNNVSVLVSGATGFIGSNLVRRLILEKANVTILIRPSSSTWRLKGIIGKVQVLEADLKDSKKLSKLLRHSEHEIVFHLAAYINHSRSISSINEAMETNLFGTINLSNCFLSRNIRAFINTGTCDEYGNNPVPFGESQRENPITPYAFSKVASTHYCQMLYRTCGFPAVTLRPFLTYGPYQIGEMLVPYVVVRCLRSLPVLTTRGEQTRELIYVSDIVDGFLLASIKKNAIGEVIDLGTGREYKVKDIIGEIVRIAGYSMPVQMGKLPYRENELLRFYCRGEKAKKILGWNPKVSLEEGLSRTIKWARSTNLNVN